MRLRTDGGDSLFAVNTDQYWASALPATACPHNPCKFCRHSCANQGGILPRPERCLAAHGARLPGAAVCPRPGGFALLLDYGGYFRKPGCSHRAVLVQHFKEVYPLVGRPFVGPVAVEAHDGTVVLQIIQIDAQHFLKIGRWRTGHYIFQRNALQGRYPGVLLRMGSAAPTLPLRPRLANLQHCGIRRVIC